ncbi:MAG: hypothetical protein R6V58_14395 [Planctomycetota bacterium]
MTKRILIWAIIVCAVAGTAYHIISTYLRSDEEKVRDAIEDCAGAIETGRPHRVYLALQFNLDEGYRHRGEMVPVDKSGAMRYLGYLVREYQDFDVDIRRIDVTIEGDRATADVWGRITAAPKDNPAERSELLTAGGRNHARIELRKDDGDWNIVSSERLEGTLDDMPAE